MQKAGWDTGHLHVLGHDIRNCILTQGWVGWPGRSTRPGWRAVGCYDTAMGGHETADRAQGRAAARARVIWLGVGRDTKIVS